MQGHFHIDKSIVSWKESSITTQCVLFCPYHMWGMSKNKSKTACKIQKNWCTVTVATTIEHHGGPGIVVLSIYIRTLFYSKSRQIKREREGNKKKIKTLIKKTYSLGFELTTPRSSGRRSNHSAMKDSWFGWSTFLIYRQPIFNTDKTVSRQSELFACRSTF